MSKYELVVRKHFGRRRYTFAVVKNSPLGGDPILTSLPQVGDRRDLLRAAYRLRRWGVDVSAVIPDEAFEVGPYGDSITDLVPGLGQGY